MVGGGLCELWDRDTGKFFAELDFKKYKKACFFSEYRLGECWNFVYEIFTSLGLFGLASSFFGRTTFMIPFSYCSEIFSTSTSSGRLKLLRKEL
jgi:hypothetical protein